MSKKIVSPFESQELKSAVICMESTSIYVDNLVYALLEDRKPGRYPQKIHAFNPKQVSKFYDLKFKEINKHSTKAHSF